MLQGEEELKNSHSIISLNINRYSFFYDFNMFSIKKNVFIIDIYDSPFFRNFTLLHRKRDRTARGSYTGSTDKKK